MATTAFMTEFRSCMTFECKTSISSSVEFSKVNNYEEAEARMTPQITHEEMEQKSSDRVPDSEQSRENRESPLSSPGTSMASSSPALHREVLNGRLNQSYELREPRMMDSSSDESELMPNDLSGFHEDLEEPQNPLEQLQCSLEKTGPLGRKISSSYSPAKNSSPPGLNGTMISATEESCVFYEGNDLYKCHLCSYSGNSKQSFNVHMNLHFDQKCPFCDYTSRTEGRLKRHIKDFHSETPPDSWAGTRVPRTDGSGGEQSMDDSVSSSGNGKPRTFRCKQCDFVAYQKQDFWEHSKNHIKLEKLLTCPQCPFVTEYKHHLEYHLRNHYGSKPFKCAKCNYSCVNKSMLNSHMKSHSNIYQYRCANCTYATKYCHSLKLHLRKYSHKPATVLNTDGTPNPYPVIDVYGTRRGPKTKKKKHSEDSENHPIPTSAIVPSPQPVNYPGVVSLLPNLMYTSPIFNSYHNSMFIRPPVSIDSSNNTSHMPSFGVKHANSSYNAITHGMSSFSKQRGNTYKCLLCDFTTDEQEIQQRHIAWHAANDNQDLIKLYGINSESILPLPNHSKVLNCYPQNQQHFSSDGTRRDRDNSFKSYDTSTVNETSGGVINNHEFVNSRSEDENEISTIRSDNNQVPKVDKEDKIPNCKTHAINQEKESDEKERGVIVEHKSEKSYSSRQQHSETSERQSEEIECRVNNIFDAQNPLDLSNTKLLDTRNESTSNTQNQNFERKTSTTAIANMSSNCHTRNRRKGKAFKIDHYIQYDEMQPAETNISKALGKIPFSQTDTEYNLFVPNEKSAKFLSPELVQSSSPVQAKATIRATNTNAENGNRDQDIHHNMRAEYPTQNSSVPVPKKVSMQNSRERKLSSENDSLTDISSLVPKVELHVEDDTSRGALKWPQVYRCSHCDMTFGDCIMHSMHMGYHGYGDPFTCNMCGQKNKNKVDFFLHIARAAHLQ
ncbi:uncharacterized protein LOC118193389 [Stegodyphus dumicola]|uniref:uncharacterized protein LOC118193389 n=1 Tax=Stegodyphus dumicola TaxID=202533 RepID=UPI0015B14026|nr:uncharacterized protein LOC118193389 [Stegodyphus dumicola]